MFIDTAKIIVQAGKGGNGVDSFYRDKLNMKGFPDGGDGGHGGDIIIRVSTNVHTLINFRYRRLFKAKNGAHGSSKQKRGKNGDTLVIEVPEGTLAYDADKNTLLKDLVISGDSVLAAKGGEGGRGNRSHKNATRGTEGRQAKLFLELKLIADAGIIGLPNAGKSTLLSKLSKARPRIASFAFTTKNPVLGVVEYDDEKTFKIAEIPGLIEDSHKGKGLGDKFLRHAERTKFFIHLIDLSKESAEEVLEDYERINKELGLYKKELLSKEQIIAGNKIDIEQSRKNLDFLENKIEHEIIPVSAKEGTGIEELVKTVTSKL